jgi:hypothetical protein
MSNDRAPIRQFPDPRRTGEHLAPGGRRGRLPRAPRSRRVALRAIYGVLSVWTLLLALGVVRLAAGRAIGGWHCTFATSTVFKLLTLAPAVPLAWTAGRRVGAARWLAVGVLSWLAAEALSGQLSALQAATMIVIWWGPWLALAPERGQLITRPHEASRPLVLAAGTAAAVCAVWAVRNAGLSTTTFPPGHSAAEGLNELRLDTAGLAVVLGLTALMAGLSHTRATLPALVVGLATAATGTAGLLWPHDLGSPGTVGTVALLAWAVVLLGTVARRRSGLVPTTHSLAAAAYGRMARLNAHRRAPRERSDPATAAQGVGGHRARAAAAAGEHPRHGGGQLRCIGRTAPLEAFTGT